MKFQKPLAYRARPKKLEDIVGQDHLIGPNGVIKRMIDNERMFSMILYGPPGVGKTTIAEAIGELYGLSSYKFNASTDTKAQLKAIIESGKHYGGLIIIDEIHRMKKDIQDYLLPHVEEGNIIMIGLTTSNPYHSVNPAIRSRAHVLKLKPISQQDIIKRMKQVELEYKNELSCTFDEEVYQYISTAANNEIRSALNALELINMAYKNQPITLEEAKTVLQEPNLSLDKNEDNYFNILSALQKSIRGSDVDAALHYLARLIKMEDMTSILRRLSVIAFEDIGLANPQIVSRMHACIDVCDRVGFPEARIPLSMMVIDLALSPKSNSIYAIDEALADIERGLTPKIPNHLINVANFEDKEPYKYPHDYADAMVYQQYMPDELFDRVYFKGNGASKYEQALMDRNKAIKKVLKKEKS